MLVYDIRDLVKRYPAASRRADSQAVRPANDHITLQIYPGEIFGLLGDNGAGKSTLVRQMANLLRSTSGSISFLGRPLGQDPLQAPLNIGYMPQETAAINNLTVGEALLFTAHLRGLSLPAARQERERLLDQWQIRPLQSKPGPQLSGGERRLTYLAVSMAASPPVLILDEPTNDLAPQRRKQVWDILRGLNRSQGVTVIFITHDAIEAEKIIQRVGIMSAGRLVAIGRPSQLKAQVDQKLRLEIFTSADGPPALPDGLQPLAVDAGRWVAYLERSQAAQVIASLAEARVDDFRLYSATLEDLYLYYADGTQSPALPDPTV